MWSFVIREVNCLLVLYASCAGTRAFALQDPTAWWQRCCGNKPVTESTPGNPKASMNPTSDSRESGESVHSEAEQLAAIEASVDESLDVLSSQSSGFHKRESSRFGSSLISQPRRSSGPKRGFGLHVSLTQQRGGPTKVGGAKSDAYTPRAESDDTSYLAAPYSPGAVASYRSDASSVYLTTREDETGQRNGGSDTSSERVTAYKMSSGSSTGTYGRSPLCSP